MIMFMRCQEVRVIDTKMMAARSWRKEQCVSELWVFSLGSWKGSGKRQWERLTRMWLHAAELASNHSTWEVQPEVQEFKVSFFYSQIWSQPELHKTLSQSPLLEAPPQKRERRLVSTRQLKCKSAMEKLILQGPGRFRNGSMHMLSKRE